ncbi:hypothetical protein LEP1GSC199_0813 [Leptospira vanthielii serovar Holland str. Waz Holland = ATCC 700522]|uniref:Uncharacterized protein n=1 Tax=Leptospira vanthielii serovar Holland str. Waz Holland = ATCC 700522 TaxID=1218591 RepID=N1W4Q4_9LEPT|nr:hypothetical protein LEP1GSC199_0813 [Leptospira vanthielii serovar Holland str. Waz Holland = ATCC 700522]
MSGKPRGTSVQVPRERADPEFIEGSVHKKTPQVIARFMSEQWLMI